MSHQTKYILYKDGNDFEDIVVFPDSSQHNVIAGMLRLTKDDILAAGFISLYTRGAVCYGTSVSLNIQTKEDTSWHATKLLYPQYRDDLLDGSHPIKKNKQPDNDTCYLISFPYDELAK